jgi:hypothetical protein
MMATVAKSGASRKSVSTSRYWSHCRVAEVSNSNRPARCRIAWSRVSWRRTADQPSA